MYNSAAGRAAIGRVAHDFYRCRRCTRLITQPELVRALGPDGTGAACTCGGSTYNPTNIRLVERLLPRVWRFAIARAYELGVRGIAANVKSNWSGQPVLPDDPTPPPGVGAPNR